MLWEYLTEGATKESKSEYTFKLENIGETLMTFHVKKRPQTTALGTPATLKRTKLEDATPPPGWKSDQENWAGIQAMLGTMKSVKGAVSEGKGGQLKDGGRAG